MPQINPIEDLKNTSEIIVNVVGIFHQLENYPNKL